MDTIERGPGPVQVDIRRHYPVAPQKVWDAWTDPETLIKWFGFSPNGSRSTTAEMEVHVGGRFRIGFASPDGEMNVVSGVYQEVVEQRRLVFTWAFQSTPERVSRISIDLAPAAGGTELHFVHDRFFDQQARDNHERGWTAMFDNFAKFMTEA